LEDYCSSSRSVVVLPAPPARLCTSSGLGVGMRNTFSFIVPQTSLDDDTMEDSNRQGPKCCQGMDTANKNNDDNLPAPSGKVTETKNMLFCFPFIWRRFVAIALVWLSTFHSIRGWEGMDRKALACICSPWPSDGAGIATNTTIRHMAWSVPFHLFVDGVAVADSPAPPLSSALLSLRRCDSFLFPPAGVSRPSRQWLLLPSDGVATMTEPIAQSVVAEQ
jgi:hypothetical protein